MEIGTIFDVGRYDVVASAQYAETSGWVVVLNNNSTHYLVATKFSEEAPDGQLEGSYQYLGDHDVRNAYRFALHHMARLAMER